MATPNLRRFHRNEIRVECQRCVTVCEEMFEFESSVLNILFGGLFLTLAARRSVRGGARAPLRLAGALRVGRRRANAGRVAVGAGIV